MTEVTSFDVFDTVLTRAVAPPSTIFLLLGKKLSDLSIIDCTPESFAHARSRAESLAYSNLGLNYSLRQIYAELAPILRLTETQRDQIMGLECALEAELLRPVPGARDRVQAARDRGHRVVFTSDMYLPAQFIQEQLVRHGFWAKGDKLYVSSEYNKSKATGELFQELVRRESVSPSLVTHIGNHPDSDIQSAKRVGLRGEYFAAGNPNRYEQILENHAWATEGLSAAMAGASRLARLTVPASNSKEAILRDVTAGVAAPVLTGYVLWVLQHAQQRGLKRLYFVSRDGQILYEIARRLVSKLNFSCEISYLYGSRQAWNLPAVTNISEKLLAWIWDATDIFSVRSLLSRVGLEPEAVRESLSSIGLTEEKDWSRNLSLSERGKLRTLLRKDGRIRELILQSAAQKRQILVKYLKQEGLLDSVDWGLVDLGWRGRMQNSLYGVLATEDEASIIGFYFGLENYPLSSEFDQQEVYFVDGRYNLGFGNEIHCNVLEHILETFCAGDHGTVISFEEDGQRVRPILKEERNHELLNWGLPLIRQTVYSFVEQLLLDSNLINIQADIRTASLELFQAFWINPSYDEAKAWGDYPWEDGVGQESYTLRLAEGYRWTQIVKALLTGTFPPRHHRATWVEGSIILSSPVMRIALGPKGRRLRRVVRRFLTSPTGLLKDVRFKIQHSLADVMK